MSKDVSVALNKGCRESALGPDAPCRSSCVRDHLHPDCAPWGPGLPQGASRAEASMGGEAESSFREGREKAEERREVLVRKEGCCDHRSQKARKAQFLGRRYCRKPGGRQSAKG